MTEDQSGMATPVTPGFPPSGMNTPPEGLVNTSTPSITVTEAEFR